MTGRVWVPMTLRRFPRLGEATSWSGCRVGDDRCWLGHRRLQRTRHAMNSPNHNPHRNPGPTPTPLPHPGNPHDARWLPPNDQDVVQVVTLRRTDGEIVVYEPSETGWIQTPDWQPLTAWE